MILQAIGYVVLALGLAVTSTGTPELVTGVFSSAECKKSTDYDSGDNNIRECRHTIFCDDREDECLRRSDTYREDGKTVTIVFCSCKDFDLDGEPTGVCHVFRKHKGARTTPQCTDGTDCGEGVCGYSIARDVWPWIYSCKCWGGTAPSQY